MIIASLQLGFFRMLKNKISRVLLVFALLLAIHYSLGIFPFGQKSAHKEPTYISYTDFSKRLDSGDFETIRQTTGTSKVVGEAKDKSLVYTNLPSTNNVLEKAQEKNVNVEITDAPQPSPFASFFSMGIIFLPVFLLIGFYYWMMRRQESQRSSGTEFLNRTVQKTKRCIDPKENKIRLTDVAGSEEIYHDVFEIVDFLKNSDVFQRVGARSPKGVLMSGPPGTGKTLLAKAIAGEAGVPFYSASGSDFMEMFVGVGASRIRDLFQDAQANAPAIIFIDEIDAVGRARSQGNMGNEERENTLNALLTEMDGFTEKTNVVVIAATNRSDILDKALTRPGRFDREVVLSLPDMKSRQSILEVHGRKIPAANDVDWQAIAKGTPGFSGAELANLVNEAAVLAAREKNSLVYNYHFNEARDKILMGVRLGTLTNKSERELVAYHEAGHAVVARFTKTSNPVYKISIMPRGRALGVTVQLPTEDSYHNHGYNRLLDDIAVLMGGRAAEQVALNEKTIGASNDFMRATVIARRIVASWGMDNDLGPISVDGENGSDWAQLNVWSEKTKMDVDERVSKLLKQQYDLACNILIENRSLLDEVAKILVDKETVEADEFENIVKQFI